MTEKELHPQVVITGADIKKIDASIKRMQWINLRDLMNNIIMHGAEIFGGAARDTVRRTHYAEQFYKLFSEKYGKPLSPKEYNDPTLFPETYEGRTLLPADLDVFIEGQDKFDKLLEYLKKNYVIKFYTKDDNVDTTHPLNSYFIERNPELKDVLTYYQVFIKKINMSSALKQVLEIYEMLGIDIRYKIDDHTAIKLDIIVLNADWKKIKSSRRYSEANLHPPFDNPDFRCNQISLVRKPGEQYNGYMLSANMQFIEEDYIPPSLLHNIDTEIQKLEYKKANLQIIIDDIIANRAVIVDRTKLIAAHRIVKMEAKGFTVDLKHILPFMHTPSNGNSDICVICYENINNDTLVMKPCSCAGLMHPICWAKFMEHINLEPATSHICPTCRKPFIFCNRIKTRGYKHCDVVKMLLDIEHYKNKNTIPKQNTCTKCRYKQEQHRYYGDESANSSDESEHSNDDV